MLVVAFSLLKYWGEHWHLNDFISCFHIGQQLAQCVLCVVTLFTGHSGCAQIMQTPGLRGLTPWCQFGSGIQKHSRMATFISPPQMTYRCKSQSAKRTPTRNIGLCTACTYFSIFENGVINISLGSWLYSHNFGNSILLIRLTGYISVAFTDVGVVRCDDKHILSTDNVGT